MDKVGYKIIKNEDEWRLSARQVPFGDDIISVIFKAEP